MKVQIWDTHNRQKVNAKIEEAKSKEMPLKKDGWQFTWKTLYKTEGSEFYKLSILNSSNQIEGMLMLSLMYDEMVYMNNIEVAPYNLGTNGRFDNVAGALIAYGCKKSFELGKNDYVGYLTFESKTKLIPLYQKRYGAILAIGQRMFINPENGIKLIDEYLKYTQDD